MKGLLRPHLRFLLLRKMKPILIQYIRSTLVDIALFLDLKIKKMLAKILMCYCYVEKFHQEQDEYISKLFHFNCQYCDDYSLFAFSCKEHPLLLGSKKWNHTLRVEILVQTLYVFFVSKLNICSTLRPIKFAWKRYMNAFRVTLFP